MDSGQRVGAGHARLAWLLGLLVLALVAGGAYWARHRPSLSSAVPAGQTESLATSSSATVRAGTSHADALPDVTAADASVEVGNGLRLTLSVSPRPPVAFAKQRFRVRVEHAAAQVSADGATSVPASLEGGRISFEMAMPMGDHRYTLVPGADGWQEAEVVLPFCKSGNPRWYAIVEGTVAGQPVVARFRLDLAKPGTANQVRNANARE